MTELIAIDKYPVRDVLSLLLKDKTTGNNITFATDTYSDYGYTECNYMSEAAVRGFASCDIQPRVFKAQADQNERTRKKAEVFTPAWICNMMNNHCDNEWFGKENVFNTQKNQVWKESLEKIAFPENKNWKMYIDSRRLEITCGEAPYIVSRYDATTGKLIPIEKRIGMLDRKLRIIGENTDTEEDWMKWTIRAYQSVYGYEFQGDNLLIARINLLVTFCDYLYAKWQREATKTELRKIANIISWNTWQMNGLTNSLPVFKSEDDFLQMSFFEEKIEEQEDEQIFCKIQDWRKEAPLSINDIIGRKKGKNMKFDYIIGNPPYQDNTIGENDTYAPPVYNAFMDASYSVADKVELIHPARFLFNAGSTPKAWNQQMLSDEHFKVLLYEEISSKVFANTDIKGGVVISYRDSNQNYGAIEIFTPYEQLNKILNKVKDSENFQSFSDIVVTSYAYHFLEKMYTDHPDCKTALSAGHEYDLKSNVFEKMPEVFSEKEPDNKEDYIRILGRENNERCYKYIRSEYVNDVCNLHTYKVFMSGATGTGKMGETIAEPIIGYPHEGSTETFLSIGVLYSENEATNVIKYIKTKFARALFSILKKTQANTPGKWKYVPIQDFASNSDIDWCKSIAEIDRQLYGKYNLSQEEIDFIETHVKEMT